MNVLLKIKKPLVIILIFSFLSGSILFIPKKAQAQTITSPTTSPASEFPQVVPFESNPVLGFWGIPGTEAQDALALKEYVLDPLMRVIARRILRMMISDTINWIAGRGQPKFITDWKSFLKDAAAIDIEKFLNELGLGFLCDPFAFQLRIALAEPRPFSERAECTIWDVVDNIQDFYNDFTQGGWDAWVKLTEPQNNFYGAYLIALDEKERRRALAKEASVREVAASLGFLGDKQCESECDNAEYNACMYECDKVPEYDVEGLEECTGNCVDIWCEEVDCQIQTPGIAIHDTLEKALHTDIDWLITSDEIMEVIIAIADTLIYRVMAEGGLVGAGQTYGQTDAGASYKPEEMVTPIEEITNNEGPYLSQILVILNDFKVKVSDDPAWVNDIDQAITAIQNYQKAMDDYKAGKISPDQFYAARSAALSATQKAAKSSSDTFGLLYEDLIKLYYEY